MLVNGAVTGTGFLMVTDLQTGEVIADSSRKGALASGERRPGDGLRAAYRMPEPGTPCDRDGDEVRFSVSLGHSVALAARTLAAPGSSWT